MAPQYCPKCKAYNFHYVYDQEESEFTVWTCQKCAYQAFENELDERECSKCNNKTESRLRDDENEYWWCSTCNTVEIVKAT